MNTTSHSPPMITPVSLGTGSTASIPKHSEKTTVMTATALHLKYIAAALPQNIVRNKIKTQL